MPIPGLHKYASASVAIIALGIALLSGCTTQRASQPGAPLETKPIQWSLSADISVDASRKLTGSAKKTRILFFTIEAPTKFVDGVFISTEGGLLTWLFGGDYDDLKAAAAYEAVYGKADVLVNPQWVVNKEDYLVYSVTRVTVTGHPGTIVSFRNGSNDGSNRLIAPTTRAFASPPLPIPAIPNSSAPPFAGDSGAVTRMNVASSVGETSSRVEITDLTPGSGLSAKPGDLVSYHYSCSLENGSTVFESRGQGGPRQRPAGSTAAPAGLGEGLVGSKAGMHRRIVIPPDLGYGSAGLPSSKIPPDATLVIDLYVDQVTPS